MNTATRTPAQGRQLAQTKAIKAAQRQLGLDDDTYRAMLQRLTGKTSATQLTIPEGAKVLDHMRQAGAVNPNRANRDGGLRRPVVAADRAALMARINALLDDLSRVTGEPHTLRYADAICKRNAWASAVDMCSGPTLHLLVGALARTLRAKRQAKGLPAGGL